MWPHFDNQSKIEFIYFYRITEEHSGHGLYESLTTGQTTRIKFLKHFEGNIQLLAKVEISLTDSISGQILIVEIDRNRQKSRNED